MASPTIRTIRSTNCKFQKSTQTLNQTRNYNITVACSSKSKFTTNCLSTSRSSIWNLVCDAELKNALCVLRLFLTCEVASPTVRITISYKTRYHSGTPVQSVTSPLPATRNETSKLIVYPDRAFLEGLEALSYEALSNLIFCLTSLYTYSTKPALMPLGFQ